MSLKRLHLNNFRLFKDNLFEFGEGANLILGKNGIEQIVEIDLSDVEKEKLAESAQGVKATNSLLSEVNS